MQGPSEPAVADTSAGEDAELAPQTPEAGVSEEHAWRIRVRSVCTLSCTEDYVWIEASRARAHPQSDAAGSGSLPARMLCRRGFKSLWPQEAVAVGIQHGMLSLRHACRKLSAPSPSPQPRSASLWPAR